MSMNDFSIQNNKKSLNKGTVNQLISNFLDDFKQIFSKGDIQQIAWDTGFIKRSSSKITGFDFLVSMLVSSLDPSHSPLEKISEILTHVSHKIKVTAQSLMERINKKAAVSFLETVQGKILKEKLFKLPEIPSALINCFSKVLLQDSSSIILHEKLQKHFKGSGGRASSSSAKFDVIYDYKAKDYELITLTDQGEADQKLALKIEDALTENTLVIRDLGYLRIDSLIQIIAKKAFFLSRLKSNILVFLNKTDEDPSDLASYLGNQFKNFDVVDLQVFITVDKLAVRLIAYKAPKEVANQRRREAKATAKKQGRNLQERTLKLMDYTIFITNVPEEIWKPELIGTVYRIRWQIELIFKCWKSRINIQYLKGINPERIRCLIYARLILIILINQLYKLTEFIGTELLGRIVSMPKVFEWMKDPDRLIRIVKGRLEGWERRYFIATIFRSMCMQTRKRKTTFESICESEIYYSKAS